MKSVHYLTMSVATLLLSCGAGKTPKGEITLPSGKKDTVKIVNLPDDVLTDTGITVYRAEFWHDGIVSYYSGNSFPKKNSYHKSISYYKARIIK